MAANQKALTVSHYVWLVMIDITYSIEALEGIEDPRVTHRAMML